MQISKKSSTFALSFDNLEKNGGKAVVHEKLIKKINKHQIMALKGKYEHAHWAVKIIQWLGCMFLLSIVAGVSILFFEQPLSTRALKWIQFVQQIALFLLPPLCVAYLWSNKPLEWLRAYPLPLPKGKGVKIGIWAMTLMLVALPAINLLGYWNQQLTLPAFLEPLEQWMKTQEESAKILTEQFMSTTTLIGLICNLLLMAVLPAMAEELTFRGVLQRLFQAKGEKGDEARRREGERREAKECLTRFERVEGLD